MMGNFRTNMVNGLSFDINRMRWLTTFIASYFTIGMDFIVRLTTQGLLAFICVTRGS